MAKRSRPKPGIASSAKPAREINSDARPVVSSDRPAVAGTVNARPAARRAPAVGRRPSVAARRPGLIPVIIAAVVVGVLAVGIAYYLSTRPPGQPTVEGTFIPDEGREHVAEGSQILYKHNPPSSGPHYPVPKDWGAYQEEVPKGYWVHNLEHGGVVFLYDCPSGCPDIVRQLEDAAKSFPRDKFGEIKLVVTPYSGLPTNTKVSAIAWDYEKDFQNDLSTENLLSFYNAHVDRGPEDIP